MSTICINCGEVYIALPINNRCTRDGCGGFLSGVLKVDNDKKHGLPWSNNTLQRTASQIFAEEQKEAFEEFVGDEDLDTAPVIAASEAMLLEDLAAEIANEQKEFEKEKLKKKINKKLTGRDKQGAYISAKQAIAKGEFSVAQKSKGNVLLQKIQRAQAKYRRACYERNLPPLIAGSHRRNSINFETSTLLADQQVKDAERPILGKASPIEKAKLDRIIKVAVMSTHGQNDDTMVMGYQQRVKEAINSKKFAGNYVATMTIGDDIEQNKGKQLITWMERTLEGRARPDVIVLLEGHVTDESQPTTLILNTRYTRKDSPWHIQGDKTHHLQNITAWVRVGIDQAVDVEIKKINLSYGESTYMAVITHKIGNERYYELVCHLPNDHANKYKTSSIEDWYEANISSISNSLSGSDSSRIINVMGDTNLDTLYDKVYSPAMTLGGGIMEETFDLALPSSSTTESKFMRQMCNPKTDWNNSVMRLHRGSYLNHVPVRDGKGMKVDWGTDHPSFISYTSVYNL
ncbi:hypothetical protein QL989_03690 [Pseudoalteromonas sp. APC 3224]|uniref:hypothetical protein n=1 Tax=Pseudoalteromonas sp. APC 3224 TaxID=3035203 RepID=UPI0025B5199A|nr:hypothetical protein [Pseudoalteromonas sp. APC 3224]MDN3484444.1 hypothetical protein [Pseudoalteromonas sp. APC 3224]